MASPEQRCLWEHFRSKPEQILNIVYILLCRLRLKASASWASSLRRGRRLTWCLVSHLVQPAGSSINGHVTVRTGGRLSLPLMGGKESGFLESSPSSRGSVLSPAPHPCLPVTCGFCRPISFDSTQVRMGYSGVTVSWSAFQTPEQPVGGDSAYPRTVHDTIRSPGEDSSASAL